MRPRLLVIRRYLWPVVVSILICSALLGGAAAHFLIHGSFWTGALLGLVAVYGIAATIYGAVTK